MNSPFAAKCFPRRIWIALACMVAVFLLGMKLFQTPQSAQAQTPGVCSNWTRVNTGAFGLDSGASFRGEEGFEVLVFDDQLYVGMEADNSLGARVWRTQAGVAIPGSQSDWEEVAADGDGNPFGLSYTQQNDHIDSLAEFQGVLYASTANRSGTLSGTLVYSSTTGSSTSWTQAITTAGFGDSNNTNFKDMITFTVGSTDYLCGGTGNNSTGTEVWCTSDGTNWTQKNTDGFGATSNTQTASSAVFGSYLYFGISNQDDVGRVYRSSDLSTWTQVFTATGRSRVEMLGEFDRDLYLAAGAYDGRNPSTEPTIQLFYSSTGDANSWTEDGTNIGNYYGNTRTIVDGATVYNDALYLSVMNASTGVEVWRTDGITWTAVITGGFGYSTTFAAELISFNGYLYAWTSDYTRGQEVLRSKCPIEQAVSVTETDTDYTFSTPIFATLNFSDLGTVSPMTVTVGVYPDAWATERVTVTGERPIKRYYDISSNGSNFTAALTLYYTDAELAASGFYTNETSACLTRWTGSAWSDCTASSRDISANTVTLNDVNEFSIWAIGGTDSDENDGEPLAVTFASDSIDSTSPLLWLLLVGGVMVAFSYWVRYQKSK